LRVDCGINYTSGLDLARWYTRIPLYLWECFAWRRDAGRGLKNC
jgi:hypothetical protein